MDIPGAMRWQNHRLCQIREWQKEIISLHHKQIAVSIANCRHLGYVKMMLLVEFVTGQTGPRKTQAPSPFPHPTPLNRLGRGVFFGIPRHCPHSGPCPTHTPDRSPFKIGGNKRGPSREWVRVGPGRGRGRVYQKHTHPAPCKGGVWRMKTRPALPRNEH